MTTVQGIRLIDVFVLGPFMVYAGIKSRIPNWMRAAMIVSGALTIIFNWSRYQEKSND